MKTEMSFWEEWFLEKEKKPLNIVLSKQEIENTLVIGDRIKYIDKTIHIEGKIKGTDGCDVYRSGIPCPRILILNTRRYSTYYCCLTKKLGVPKICPLSENKDMKISVNVYQDQEFRTFIIQDIMGTTFKLVKEYVV